MVTNLLHLFIFISWGLGLFAAFSALLMALQEHGLRMSATQAVLSRPFVRGAAKQQPTTTPEIPDELRKLMDMSPDHPEVSEIDGKDEVIGVLFKAQSYPPSLDDDDNEE